MIGSSRQPTPSETISSGKVTYDLERQLEDAEKLATSEFAAEVVANIENLSKGFSHSCGCAA